MESEVVCERRWNDIGDIDDMLAEKMKEFNQLSLENQVRRKLIKRIKNSTEDNGDKRDKTRTKRVNCVSNQDLILENENLKKKVQELSLDNSQLRSQLDKTTQEYMNLILTQETKQVKTDAERVENLEAKIQQLERENKEKDDLIMCIGNEIQKKGLEIHCFGKELNLKGKSPCNVRTNKAESHCQNMWDSKNMACLKTRECPQPMTEAHRNVLLANRCAIIQDLIPELIMDFLIQEHVISENIMEKIKCHSTRRERATALLDYLPSRGDQAFYIFVQSLEKEFPHLKVLLSK